MYYQVLAASPRGPIRRHGGGRRRRRQPVRAVGRRAGRRGPVGQGFNLNLSDLRFILKQIKIAEAHAVSATAENPCGTLLGTGPNQIPNGNQQGAELPWGLRTVDGTCNNLLPGQEKFGAADTRVPAAGPARFRDAETGDPDGPGPHPTAHLVHPEARHRRSTRSRGSSAT